MKSIARKISILALCAGLFMTCTKDDDNTGGAFGVDKTEILADAEGGIETVVLTAGENWVATTTETWILISPANGIGSTVCDISIDSTLAYSSRTGTVNFVAEGKQISVPVTQFGFGKEVVVPDEFKEISVPDFDQNAYIDVEIYTNVAIDPKFSESWLGLSKAIQQDLTSKARPRKVEMRLRYDFNINPQERVSVVNFTPKNEDDELQKAETITVKQQAAPEIEVGTRAGDSLTLLTVARMLNSNSYSGWSSGRSMMYWSGVEMNDDGRVTSVQFYMNNIPDGGSVTPHQLTYLDQLEELSIFSNANVFMKSTYVGPEIGTLDSLKVLTLYSLGLTEIDESLANLKKLEYLDLNNNNLTEIPWHIINQDNLPALRYLDIGNMGRRNFSFYDLSNVSPIEYAENGLHGNLPHEMFKWDSLRVLRLSFDLYEGAFPTEKELRESDPDFFASRIYILADTAVTGSFFERPELLNRIKILPVITTFRFNGCRLSGDVPDWMVDHPNVCIFDPWSMSFTQDGRDSSGELAGFTNIPDDEAKCFHVWGYN